jgi:hypothetical protein
MLLASVLITAPDGGNDPALPPIIVENIESLKRHHPDLPHRLFREGDVIALIDNKFPREVREAYFALRPFAYRADLARYCILHEFGGLYADVAYYFVRPVPMPERQAVVFRGNLMSAPWDTSNGIIYAQPGHKALALAIEMVCANVKRQYYGPTGLCPTGPALWGKAVATTCEAEELLTGSGVIMPRTNVQQMAPDVTLPTGDIIHVQLLNRELVAVKRKPLRSQGLVELGVTTGNFYRDLWNQREVYGEENSPGA